MTEAEKTKPAGLLEYIDRFIADTLERCTFCAKCFEVCPMTKYSPKLSAADGPTVVRGILDVLRQQPGSPEALEWIELCTQSARCVDACPDNVNAMKMMRVARFSALGSLGGVQQMASRADRNYFRKVAAFSQMQLSEAELEEWQR